MKTNTLKSIVVLLFLLMSTFLMAQKKIQVPANVIFYMEVNTKQLKDKADWQILNPILQDLNKNEVEKPTWKDFSDTGVSKVLRQYHYATFNDTVKTYTAHLALDDPGKFLNFLNISAKKDLEVTKKNNYSYVHLNDESFVAWNDKKAVMTLISYTKTLKVEPWYDQDSIAVAMDSVTIASDSIVAMDSTWSDTAKPFNYKDEIQYLKDEIQYQKDDIKEHQQTIAQLQKDIKYLEKHHRYPEDQKTEATETDEVASAKPTEEYDEEAEDAAYQKELDSIKAEDFKIVRSLAELDFDRYFNTWGEFDIPKALINFKDDKADVFAYLNSSEIFQNGLYKKMLGPLKLSGLLQNFYDSNTFYNLYFEKSKVRLVSNYQHKDADIQNHVSAVYRGKKNRKLTALIQDKSIGYYALNLDGYKYFDLMYSFFSNRSADQTNYQKELELVLETVKIALDEKAIAEIAPGNGIFVLNELSSKKVEYTDYEYDENYNSKEVKKLKDVVTPDFTFAFATENEKYWKKVFDVLTSRKELAQKFVKNGDLYFFRDDAKSNVFFDQLCFTVKDGMVFLTTSPSNLVAQKQSSVTEKLAKDAARYPLSGRLDMRRFLNGLEQEFKTSLKKDSLDFLRKNMGDLEFRSEPKNGSIETEIIYTTPTSSANSLMYFFDVCRDVMKMNAAKTVAL